VTKVAIITGAGSGVGRETAKKLSEDDYLVILIGRREEKLKETQDYCSNETWVMPMDVSNINEVKICFEKIEKEYSRLDLVFNNAGVFIPGKTADQVSYDEWKYVIDTNINGMFLFSKFAFSLMKRQTPQGGRIINNGSISSITPRPGSLAYTTTKHAVTGMTKSLSLDGRPYNIVCSQIDIGNAETPMTTNMKNGILQASGLTEKEPVFDPVYVAEAVLNISKLPLDTNILNMTIMASKMPFVGRG
jgi:NADP-dependent 3-hydroxy acid dehydrogenase YdfG